MNIIALAFGLGVAGFDVFGAVLVVLLVASKLPKQRIAAFALVVLVGMVTAGVAASLLLGGSAELFAQALHHVPACVWVGAALCLVALSMRPVPLRTHHSSQ